MATFKVGQRVRLIAYTPHRLSDTPLGSEGTIVSLMLDTKWGGRHAVEWDRNGKRTFAVPEQLAPLTDPLADRFIESIKRLKPYEEPKVAPSKVYV